MGISKLATTLALLVLCAPAVASDGAVDSPQRPPRHAVGGTVLAAAWTDGFDTFAFFSHLRGSVSRRGLVPGLSLRYDRVFSPRTALRISVSGMYSSATEDPSQWWGPGVLETRLGGVALAVGPRLRYDVAPRLRVGGEQLARVGYGAYGEHLTQPEVPEALDAEGNGHVATGRSAGTTWFAGTTTSVAAEVLVVDGFWFGMGATVATIGYERSDGEYRETQTRYEGFEVADVGDTETREASGKSFVLTGPSGVAATLTFEW